MLDIENDQLSLETHLKVKFLILASDTISLVAEAEAFRDPELAHSIQSLAERVRAMAAAIEERDSASTDSTN